MSGAQEGSVDGNDPLDLTSLDADSLFNALGAVDRAIPDLLLSVKPVLSHLTSPAPELTAESANRAIETYMSTLDKIQFVLRQTVYYLRETRASTSALRPPPAGAIPTPFAASLPLLQNQQVGGSDAGGNGEGAIGAGGNGVELGLYGMRTEVRVMEELARTLERLKEEMKAEDGLVGGSAGQGARSGPGEAGSQGGGARNSG